MRTALCRYNITTTRCMIT